MHHPHPLTYSVNDAIAVSSIGRTRLYELIGQGKIETVKVGRRTLIKATSLKRLLETEI
jgi:excisionase family DNA binding protein